MIRAVADTHAVIWYLYDDRRLSARAKTVIEDAALRGEQIAISAISLAEMVYLAEKARVDPGTLELVFAALDAVDTVFVQVPVDRQIVQTMRSVSRAAIPDFPDRIIAATAVQLGVPLISRDGKITLSAVATIW